MKPHSSGGNSSGGGGSISDYAFGVATIVNGTGHVNVWGDEWITYDSTWTGAYQVQTYWNNVLAWLGQCP